jgi:hypothetical protein
VRVMSHNLLEKTHTKNLSKTILPIIDNFLLLLAGGSEERSGAMKGFFSTAYHSMVVYCIRKENRAVVDAQLRLNDSYMMPECGHLPFHLRTHRSP